MKCNAILAFFNLLKKLRIVPSEWKTIPYTPAYKKGNRHDAKNYRPLGSIPALSSAVGKLVDYSIRLLITLSHDQTGFRPVFSTHTLLLRVEMAIKNRQSDRAKLIYSRCWLSRSVWPHVEAGHIILTMGTGHQRGHLAHHWRYANPNALIRQNKLRSHKHLRHNRRGHSRFGAGTLFISPLSAALTGVADTFGHTRLPPQMFADDVTILANFRLLLALTMAWSKKWGSLVNMDKSLIRAYPQERSSYRT